MLTHDDVRYIRSEFVPLESACAAARRDPQEIRHLIAERQLPAAPYVLPDGTPMVPADYFELSPDGLAAADREAFLDGTYFVCLRCPTPDNIGRKEKLVDELRPLVAEPRPAEAAWRAALKARVDELDGLERPFSPHYDRVRFGRPPTRDELIAEPRRRWPELWRAGA
jgi:hypothetical protein